MKQNYDVYRFTKTEFMKYLFQSIFLCVLVDYLFYQSYLLIPFLLPVPFFYLKWKKKERIQERRKQLNYQFKDALNSLCVAIQAGYSVENAISACTRDLERLYKKEDDIMEEFHYIESQQKVSVPVEELLLDFGSRSGVEDIENFASVFYSAKRTGGDMTRILQKAARILGDKIDVKKEIEAALAARKSEQLIMSLMPAGIIVYLQATSPGFLSVLYGNPFGIITMTICLLIYGGAYLLGLKIVDIEV